MIDNESMLMDQDEQSKNVIFRLALDKTIKMKVIAAKKQITVNSLYNEGVDYVLEKYSELLRND